jgi:hypothetical protein
LHLAKFRILALKSGKAMVSLGKKRLVTPPQFLQFFVYAFRDAFLDAFCYAFLDAFCYAFLDAFCYAFLNAFGYTVLQVLFKRPV